MDIRFDCRYLKGEKPCKYKILCNGCTHYLPLKEKILIIKLGAIGDVLRTTPILKPLKERYPESFITWLVDEASYMLLAHNRYIDKVYNFNYNSALILMAQSFDILICLEKEERAAAMASLIKAHKRYGFGLSEKGILTPLSPSANYAYMLGISDQLKFYENKKTYQEIIFEMLELPYNNNEYMLEITKDDNEYASILFKKLGLSVDRTVVGFSPGAGPIFAKKAWIMDNYIELINRLGKRDDIKMVLLGGVGEIDLNKKIKQGVGVKLYDTGCHNSLSQFSAIVKRCNLLICGDTLPMHLAIAHKRHVLALFGPTCPQEIELYGRGRIIVSKAKCAPCYKNKCDIVDDCMKAISVDEVYDNAVKLIDEIKAGL